MPLYDAADGITVVSARLSYPLHIQKAPAIKPAGALPGSTGVCSCAPAAMAPCILCGLVTRTTLQTHAAPHPLNREIGARAVMAPAATANERDWRRLAPLYRERSSLFASLQCHTILACPGTRLQDGEVGPHAAMAPAAKAYEGERCCLVFFPGSCEAFRVKVVRVREHMRQPVTVCW
jgi:hypothetical protein